MALIKNDKETTNLTERQILENKYLSSCGNILLVLIFSLINVVLLVINSNTYFLFSAYVPYFIADLGMTLCGLYPAEYYTDLAGLELLPKESFAVFIVIVAIILALYLVCWLLAKKQKSGWMIVALVLFIVDTLVMLLLAGFSMDAILDYLFHGWVLISLISGLAAAAKLKKLPEEEELAVDEISAEADKETVAAIEEN